MAQLSGDPRQHSSDDQYTQVMQLAEAADRPAAPDATLTAEATGEVELVQAVKGQDPAGDL